MRAAGELGRFRLRTRLVSTQFRQVRTHTQSTGGRPQILCVTTQKHVVVVVVTVSRPSDPDNKSYGAVVMKRTDMRILSNRLTLNDLNLPAHLKADRLTRIDMQVHDMLARSRRGRRTSGRGTTVKDHHRRITGSAIN